MDSEKPGTTEGQCQAILKRIFEEANKLQTVWFERDFGGNSITVGIDDVHTHVGMDDMEWAAFISQLYDNLNGAGMSWAQNEWT